MQPTHCSTNSTCKNQIKNDFIILFFLTRTNTQEGEHQEDAAPIVLFEHYSSEEVESRESAFEGF